MIRRQPEEPASRLDRLGHFGLAARPLHEDHLAAAAPGTTATRSSVSGIGPTARLITPPSRLGIIRAELVAVDFDALRAPAARKPRAGRQREPRAARPGSSAPPAGRSSAECRAGPAPSPCRSAVPAVRRTEHQQAVDIVLQHHVLEVVDPRQIERGVRLPKHPVISPQALNLAGLRARCHTAARSFRAPWVRGSQPVASNQVAICGQPKPHTSLIAIGHTKLKESHSFLVVPQSSIDGLLGAGLLTPPWPRPKVSIRFTCQSNVDGSLARADTEPQPDHSF